MNSENLLEQISEHPEAFLDIGDALAALDSKEEEAREEMEKFAEQEMSQVDEDPTKQWYFARLDRKTIIRTEAEYQACLEQKVAMKIVSYNAAQNMVAEEAARAKSVAKARSKQKAAKRARKRNR